VLALSEMRGPAAVAQTLYRETEASKEARLKAEAERKAMREFAPLPEHRPSKRDGGALFNSAADVEAGAVMGFPLDLFDWTIASLRVTES